ncbi:hypothetical protein [Anaeromyxobacter oryzae]|uniref:Uncharacterized protein n=1 Tax=Anaeromyxobacter oryzae TaxID=2918170 RepID=A0ABM7X4B8_9BACT|nr:hypothetical protein [Anaeromyxobacter oryzae]BDG06651.1 hypothetical protein AMOR_56470 [Anaeromyxobacter oryzae]
MARRGRGFAGALFETGTKLVSTAVEGMMKDPRGQEAVARAVGLAQRGKRRVEELQEKVMQAAGIPGRQDYQDLAKQLARIKRKARELGEKVDAARGNGSGGEPGEGPGEGGSTH